MRVDLNSMTSQSAIGRPGIVDLGIAIAQARKEATTGQRADLGLAIGAGIGNSVRIHELQDQLTAARDANGLTKARLDATQEAMKSVTTDANEFVQALVAARYAGNGPELIQSQAKNFLNSVVQALNTQVSGVFVFGGTAYDQPPLPSATSPPQAALNRMDANFLANFGFTTTDPSANTITSSAMQSFLDSQTSAAFGTTPWSQDWSVANSTAVTFRINVNETATLDSSANADGIRQLVKAMSTVISLAKAPLNTNAFQTLVDSATKDAQGAIEMMTRQQSALGVVQERVSQANIRLGAAVDLMTSHLTTIEDVDPYEASTRLSSLTTQLETTYAVTARLSKMSLINYL